MHRLTPLAVGSQQTTTSYPPTVKRQGRKGNSLPLYLSSVMVSTTVSKAVSQGSNPWGGAKRRRVPRLA
jgi:hypothetical protein